MCETCLDDREELLSKKARKKPPQVIYETTVTKRIIVTGDSVPFNLQPNVFLAPATEPCEIRELPMTAQPNVNVLGMQIPKGMRSGTLQKPASLNSPAPSNLVPARKPLPKVVFANSSDSSGSNAAIDKPECDDATSTMR